METQITSALKEAKQSKKTTSTEYQKSTRYFAGSYKRPCYTWNKTQTTTWKN